MKLKNILVFSVFILILMVGAVSANENITEDISQTQDGDLLENTVSEKSFADIQTAVNNAKANDIIELNGTYSSSGSEIKVNKNLVFDGGKGSTLDGKKLSGIFKTTSEKYTITLKNINFINSKDNVFFDADNLNSEGKLIIDNCNFTDNEGKEYGALCCYECIVTNSNFLNNNAKGLYDGDNYVSWGGAISCIKCSLINCNFEKNTALTSGGAVEAYECSATNCNFTQNSANEGGAIYAYVDIKDSNFTSNSAKSFDGGAIVGDGEVSNSIFESNVAGFRGGAIAGSVSVSYSVFSRNKASYGGAIHSIFANVELINCKFESNDDAAVIADGISVKTPNKTFKGKTILDNNLNSVSLIKVNVKKLKTSYKSGNNLKIHLTKTISKKPASGIGVGIAVYKGKKLFDAWQYTDEFVSPNSKSIATFKASKLPAGKYTIKIFEGYLDNDDDFFVCPIPVTKTTVKVVKAKTVVKAPKITAKFKKSKYFKVTVKSKSTKKPISKIKLKVKVYTGKKYEVYKIKTNKKGVAKLNTKKLSRGSHNVVISPKKY